MYDVFLVAYSQYVWLSLIVIFFFPTVIVNTCLHDFGLLSTDIIPFGLLNEVLSEIAVSHIIAG